MSDIVYKYRGKAVTHDQLDSLMPRKSNWLDGSVMVANTYTEHDPLISEGCGVMKSQVAETRQLIEKHKIQGAAVLDSGQIRFTSRRARKDFLQMRGLVDIDGGWSD